MNPMLQAAIGSIIRAGVGWAFAWLVKAGIWQPSEAEVYVTGATLFILTAGWGIWKNSRWRQKFLTALTMPEWSTENDVKAHIASGLPTPPLSTPKDRVPLPPAA